MKYYGEKSDMLGGVRGRLGQLRKIFLLYVSENRESGGRPGKSTILLLLLLPKTCYCYQATRGRGRSLISHSP